MAPTPVELIYTAPQEFFFTQLSLAFFGALFLGFPYLAVEIYGIGGSIYTAILAMLAVTERFTLASLVVFDMRAVLRDLARDGG